MLTKANLRTFLWLGMVLLLLMTPLSDAHGQDVPDGDTTGQGADEVAPDGESEGAVVPGEDEAATEDGAGTAADLSYRLFLPAIQGGNTAADQVEAAFLHSWAAEACVNVTNSSSNRGLWDDMPGPGGANNEAGLLWFITNDGLNERCSYRSAIGGIGVLATQVRFRVAVNDTARFYVRVYRLASGVCQLYRSYATSSTSDDSQFRAYSYAFTQARICRVQILLTDDPDAFNAAVDRSSALIDYVRLYNGGVLTWQEGFTN